MISRDISTDYYTKQSLPKPFKVVVLVSCAHIPFRARSIVRGYLCSGYGGSAGQMIDTPIIITDIIVRELGFFAQQKYVNKTNAVTHLEKIFESESSRAKLTYVREFHTFGSMRKLRASKPDLIIDISEGAEIHGVVIEESRLGILRVEQTHHELYAVLHSLTGREVVKNTTNDHAKQDNKIRLLLHESICELLTR